MLAWWNPVSRLQASRIAGGKARRSALLRLASRPGVGTVALNTRLLGQVLQGVASARLKIAVTTPQTPVLLREAGHEGVDAWVVMPMHDPSLLERRKEV